MKKRRNCDGKTSYSCGGACINDQKACEIDSSPPAKKVASGMTSMVGFVSKEIDASIDTSFFDAFSKPTKTIPKQLSKTASKDSFKTPIVDSKERTERRNYLKDKYFGGDDKKVEAFEKQVSGLTKDLSIKLVIDEFIADKIKAGDGLLKNQLETKTSGGELDTDKRLKVEKEFFGYDGKDVSNNPKYGYLHTPSLSNVAFYGDSLFETKKIPKEQYTVTFGDSLENNTFGSRADNVKIESFSEKVLENSSLENVSSLKDLQIEDYIEAQIGGKVDFNSFNLVRNDLEEYW